MSKIELKGALRYDIKSSMAGVVIFLVVMVVVWLLNFILSFSFGGEGVYSSGFEMGTAIFMFVLGINSIRQDLRIFLQNGRGRTTVFLSQLIITVVISAVMAVMAGLLIELFQLITALGSPQMEYASFYSMVGLTSGLGTFLNTVAYTFLQCIPTFLFGMMVSLIYYRLPKLGRVIFSIAVPGVLFVGLRVWAANNPALGNAFGAFIKFVVDTLQTPLMILAAFTLVMSPIMALISWLLLRRAEVK